jgi:hypothetical protein
MCTPEGETVPASLVSPSTKQMGIKTNLTSFLRRYRNDQHKLKA